MNSTLSMLATGVLGLSALAMVGAASPAPPSSLAPDSRCFELRTYTAAPGKLEALHARFRDHTSGLFKKHGMTLVGYWVPTAKDKADNTLVYVLAYPDCAAREKAWESFRTDPEWIRARDASEAGGKIVEKADSMLMTATDYSPMK